MEDSDENNDETGRFCFGLKDGKRADTEKIGFGSEDSQMRELGIRLLPGSTPRGQMQRPQAPNEGWVPVSRIKSVGGSVTINTHTHIRPSESKRTETGIQTNIA